jgi:hypothetical protein
MVADWIESEFTEYELILINKLCLVRRFCNAHMQEESLLSGVKKNKIGDLKKALKNISRKGIIRKYKAQDRYDYCFPMENYVSCLTILKRYSGTYPFIDVSFFPENIH